MKKPLLAGAVALALLAPNPLLAKSSSSAGATQSTRADATTQNFVDKVWNINNFEIEAGQEAQNKANIQEFLDYARMIVRDHVKAGSELNAILGQNGFNAPNALDAEHKNLLQAIVLDHRRAIRRAIPDATNQWPREGDPAFPELCQKRPERSAENVGRRIRCRRWRIICATPRRFRVPYCAARTPNDKPRIVGFGRTFQDPRSRPGAGPYFDRLK